MVPVWDPWLSVGDASSSVLVWFLGNQECFSKGLTSKGIADQNRTVGSKGGKGALEIVSVKFWRNTSQHVVSAALLDFRFKNCFDMRITSSCTS